MGAAAADFLHRPCGVVALSVNDCVSTKMLCMCELTIVDVDGADIQAHRLGVLNCQMSEAADA